VTGRTLAWPAAVRRPAVRHGVLAGVAALLVGVTGCGVPVPEIPTDEVGAPVTGGTPLPTSDAGGEALVAQLAALDDAVAAVAAALDDAAAAAGRGDLDAARAAGGVAVALLLGDGAAVGLLPAIDPDRAAASAGDLLSATVTSAGDVGGERARIVLELLRDPLVGDLGAWQRDPVGVVDLLRSAVSAAGPSTSALDAGVTALPGELTRALGYALAVEAAPDAALAAHAATAGAARLGVVRVALELGAEALGAAGSEATVGADAEDGR
jgi:hypothetical protein